jgi:hypothetical protein
VAQVQGLRSFASQAPAEYVFDSPIQGISDNGIVVYSFRDKASFDKAKEVGTIAQNQAIAAEIERTSRDEEPVRPVEPVDGEFITATGGGNDYELDMGEDGRIFGTQYIKNLGTGKVTKGKKAGELLITFGKTNHAKYGKGVLEGTNEGRRDVFVLTFTTQDGDIANRAKVPFKVSKSRQMKSAVPSKGRFQPYTASYQTGISNAGQFTAPAARVAPAYNPFAQGDKYDVFGGGGTGVNTMDTSDLKTLIKQLQSQLDSEEGNEDEDEVFDVLQESYKKSLRGGRTNKPRYRRTLTEGTNMKKVSSLVGKYKNQLKKSLEDLGIDSADVEKALTNASKGVFALTGAMVPSMGALVGALVKMKELTKQEGDNL